jgi:hypothetical protein
LPTADLCPVTLIGKIGKCAFRSNCRNSPMITPFKLVSRCGVEKRNGRLYVAGVRINVSAEHEAWRAVNDDRRSFSSSGVTLDDRTLIAVDDALTAVAQAAGPTMPVGLDARSRLHSCVRCGARFIAPPAARLCSAECGIASGRASQRKASAKRTIRREERRAALQVPCRQCGEPVESPSRASRAFCSNVCRQAAYRARAAAPV